MKTTFTSESVCAGHPDKICDQISDAILDETLKQDKFGRVAVETLVTYNRIIVVGEISADAKIDFKNVIKNQIKRLGYIKEFLHFSYKSPIEIYIHEQSPEIAKGVKMQGAGDQGMMFGFACDETETFMPLPITIAHYLVRKIDEIREKNILKYLRPDGKSQITIAYENDRPVGIESIVLAVPHSEKVNLRQVKEDLFKKVVSGIEDKFGFKIGKDNLIVNGTGIWHMGGPASDSGVTGRKIIVDSYGGYARVGGGCFSGKDPSKVDRSGAYGARYIAKNIVANKLARKVEVRLAYFIGATKPLMQEIDTFGTENKPLKFIKDFARKILDTSVEGMLNKLNLRRPIYLNTASYGHFGRNEFPWEKIIKI